ncbi:MAG TPA: hypothetical protein VGG55_02510 [Candidatus Acidoferrales bacterium]|jgi:hypothetical protein
MSDAPVLFPGQHVRVRVLGSGNEWTYGTVAIASANGVSAAIRFEGFMRTPQGVTCGVLPLMIDDATGTATGALDGNEYEGQTRVTGPPLEVQ